MPRVRTRYARLCAARGVLSVSQFRQKANFATSTHLIALPNRENRRKFAEPHQQRRDSQARGKEGGEGRGEGGERYTYPDTCALGFTKAAAGARARLATPARPIYEVHARTHTHSGTHTHSDTHTGTHTHIPETRHSGTLLWKKSITHAKQ